MTDPIDYDVVAEYYDLYTRADYDYAFFLERVGPGIRVLELTAGTGRLSVALAKAGAILTCVDISKGMLARLERKLEKEGLRADVLCADARRLALDESFDTAILPFQSFMEFVGRDAQLDVLRSAYRAIVPGGRFYCTMHNPNVRRKSVDGVLRGVGTFEHDGGYVVVTGFEVGGDPVVRRSQFIEHFDASGHLGKRIHQPMAFELIDEGAFRDLAAEAGFRIVTVYGDYTPGEFDSESSPVMIWELEKPEP